jgi:guanine nucleotide-binding protein G(i) subunit alpha
MCWQSIQVILEAMEELQIPINDRANDDHAALVIDYPSQVEESVLDPSVTEAIKSLWADKGVQACYARAREYQLNDSAGL